jgi:hypothetical protein
MDLPRDGHRLGGVGRFANHFEIGFRRQQSPDSLPEQGVIVS